MKQFGKILKFELKNYLANKVFIGITVFLVVLIAFLMFLPRLSQSSESAEPSIPPSERPVMLIAGDTDGAEVALTEAFAAAFTEYHVTTVDAGSVQEQITSGQAECAFVMHGLTSYTYYVANLSMYDSNTLLADEVLQNLYRVNAMINSGLSPEQALTILNTPIQSETVSLGKDQMQNFFYTYVMIFALYMVILLYGQMVATGVATEKSSRAMELLITSAKPVSMMFGKVLAACLAGLIQLIAVFGSAVLFFNLNKSFLDDGGVISSLFNIPPELLGYMLIFFVLGFLIYAFLYGAIGSTASKLEDINTSVMPVTMLFIIGFFVVIFGMTSGEVDSVLMKICSFIPFTSPMAMFTRIAMSTVPFYEILISIIILILSVAGIGVLSAKIYRIGVLLYGKPPKIGSILKMLCKK